MIAANHTTKTTPAQHRVTPLKELGEAMLSMLSARDGLESAIAATTDIPDADLADLNTAIDTLWERIDASVAGAKRGNT